MSLWTALIIIPSILGLIAFFAYAAWTLRRRRRSPFYKTAKLSKEAARILDRLRAAHVEEMTIYQGTARANLSTGTHTSGRPRPNLPDPGRDDDGRYDDGWRPR